MNQNRITNIDTIIAMVDDDLLRLETLYKITTKQGKLENFKPNEIQRRINADKSKRKIILKARQFGVTTNEVIKMLDYALWTPNRNACILAHEQDGIRKIFSIARRAYDNLPYPCTIELDRGGGSQYEMRFPEMGSKIYCDLESRGDTIHWLHISEAAFVDDPDRIKATMQAVPLNGIITLESTPNGLNWFHDEWMNSGLYSKHFYPWFLHHEYKIETDPLSLSNDEEKLCKYAKNRFNIDILHSQIAFRRLKQRELKHLFQQEYPEDEGTCFLASGSNPMDMVKLHEVLLTCPTVEPVDGLKVFEKFHSKGRYVVGADTAEGYDGDYCAAVVIDCTTRKQVATLHGRWKPSEFAKRLVDLCNDYSKSDLQKPLLGVERNLHGHACLLELSVHLHYPNLFVDSDDKLGWITNSVSRPILINNFIDAVENKTILFKDEALIKECLTLVNKNGKIEAETGKHDDLVMSAGVAVQMFIKHGSVDLYENISSLIKV